MRMILDATINNSNLPLIDPLISLVKPESLGVYGMLDLTDSSGVSGNLSYAGSFGASGALLTADSAGVITTPVKEQDEMTIIVCWNMAQVANTVSVAIGNMTPEAAPFSGWRHYTAANGTGQTTMGTGASSPATTSFAGGTVGAWTVQAFTISNSLIQKITHSGAVTSAAVSARSKSALPFYINGVPDNVAAPQKGGNTGTIGLVAFYNKVFTTAEIVALLDSAAAIMADRGVIVP